MAPHACYVAAQALSRQLSCWASIHISQASAVLAAGARCSHRKMAFQRPPRRPQPQGFTLRKSDHAMGFPAAARPLLLHQPGRRPCGPGSGLPAVLRRRLRPSLAASRGCPHSLRRTPHEHQLRRIPAACTHGGRVQTSAAAAHESHTVLRRWHGHRQHEVARLHLRIRLESAAARVWRSRC